MPSSRAADAEVRAIASSVELSPREDKLKVGPRYPNVLRLYGTDMPSGSERKQSIVVPTQHTPFSFEVLSLIHKLQNHIKLS
jgi:hypothetical protein